MSAAAVAKAYRLQSDTHRHDEAGCHGHDCESAHLAAFAGAIHGEEPNEETDEEEDEVEHGW